MTAHRLWCGLVVVAGCWPQQDLIGGVFTQDQLDGLREQFPPLAPIVDICPPSGADRLAAPHCQQAADLGQALFFDPRLSAAGTLSCETCHAPDAWYADDRPERAVSMGAVDWTKRNTISLVNLAYKPAGTFSWEGLPTAADVITQKALFKAMATSPDHVASLIASSPYYRPRYEAVFGPLPADPTAAPSADAVTWDVALALEAYARQLISRNAPFDRFIAGDMTAMSDAAIRGFGVFVGRGLCVECHRGSLFSDFDFHVTGVAQRGEHVQLVDMGRGDTGAFLTAPLRHSAHTAPYLHVGSMTTLAEVVDFYHWGGEVSGYSKDRFIEPLELAGSDADDLVAFMEALTGEPVADALTRQPPGAPCDPGGGAEGLLCGGACVDATLDPAHCGSCGQTCTGGTTCIGGACGCPDLNCGGMCFDGSSDPWNCGACNNACPMNKPSCVAGVCQ